ncbi:MAG: hypothetical protein J4431_03470 [Candidatus Aenigmarchaeota archaeon]|nr:hypothetical protein [Candidatus Aenigmarchaeota archaeon]
MLNRRRGINSNLAAAGFVAIFILGLLGGYYYFGLQNQEAPIAASGEESRTVEMIIAAVDSEGNGVTGKLFTTVRPAASPGSGQVLVSVNNVLSQLDTQASARTAVHAAGRYADKDIGDYDVIYVMEVNAQSIEGPSAGAAMAVSALAALNGNSMDPRVSITGAIREDGTIAPVGGIEEKLAAAKKAGVTTFLVPGGQSSQSTAERSKACTTRGGYEYCRIVYAVKKTSISDEVKEVSDIGEALAYFVKN